MYNAKRRPGGRLLTLLLGFAMVLALLPISASAAGEENAEAEDVYVLMNIPYSEFYNAVGVSDSGRDYDAITSATNKVGNYGKAGGGYHGAVPTAQSDGEGNYTAVGGENGAKVEGVIWPVKTTAADLTALGGTMVADSSSKVIATLGRGQTSATTVVSYQTLMEEDSYSYYELGEAVPDYYLTLTVSNGAPTFSMPAGTAAEKTGADVSVTYGSNWGDVQIALTGVDDVSDLMINAVVVTAKDESDNEAKSGFVLLNNVWSAADMAWKVAQTPGLDGKTITNITYYCSVKDGDTTDSSAPAYANYVYSYSLGTEISPVYTGTITAAFDSASQITIDGLPENAENVQAKVYHTTGGRNPVITYLTPLQVDPNDGDIDPITAGVDNGKVSISDQLVTVTSGENSSAYGCPVDGTEYTIELSSDNWVFNKISATYTANDNSGDSGADNSENNSENSSGSDGTTGAISGKSSITVERVSGGSASVDILNAEEGDTVTLTVAPDSGYELSGLAVTDKNGTAIELVKVSDTVYTFTMPADKATVTPAFAEIGSDDRNDSPFADVSSDAYYYDAVLWAAGNGIAAGTGADEFSPDASCTRAQMVTFLWRAAGSPAPAGADNPFTDVGSGEYYYDAVLWAVENGITNGTSATTFSPDAAVTRGQTATFLYRHAGSPDVSGESAFVDVAAGEYYADAVKWAFDNGITDGTGGSKYGPEDDCTRAQIVTFLYRDLAE